jgi:hypothetical protein
MTGWMIGVLVSLSTPVGLPSLQERSADWIATRWMEVKDADSHAEQHTLHRRHRLNRLRCRGLLPITDYMRRDHPPLRLRDTLRDRTAARPEMIAVVSLATQRFHKRAPKAVITVGDISQPGCGQIRYGVVIRFLRGKNAEKRKKDAVEQYGAPTVFEPMDPMFFIDEHPRFSGQLGPIWWEQRFTGVTAAGDLRVEERRFDKGDWMVPISITRLIYRTRRRLRDRDNVVRSRVRHVDDTGTRRWVHQATWSNWESKRWIEVTWKPGVSRHQVTVQSLLRVREARILKRKPTSRQYEERYLFLDDGEAGVHVRRHNVLYEAHHSSHMAGLDADLSYVTERNFGPFEPTLSVINAAASWAWLRELHRAARDLRVPIRAMFVDQSIKNRLLRVPGVSRRDPLWRTIRVSRGHDSHVHLRLGASRPFRNKSLDEILGMVSKHVR